MNEEMKERLIQGETIPDKIDEALLEELADQRACHFGLDILLADSAQDDDLINAVCDELSAERASQNASPSTTYAWSKLAGLAAAGMVCFGSGVFVGWHRSHESALINAPSANHESILQGTERGGYATEAAGIQSWEHFQRLAHHEDTESLAEAYHEISKTLSGPQEREAINLLIYRWAELDPNGALSFLQEQDSTRDVATLFGAWARLDSDAAWGAAMQLEPPSASRAAAQPILAYLAKSDPSQFLERAAVTAVTEDSVWATAFESFVENGEDPTKHLKNLTGKPRREAIRGMARAMAKADAGHALEMAKNLTQAGDRASALTSVLHVMGERDPSAAGKALQEFPGQFPEVEKAIVEQLRKKDPFEAIDWIREFTEDKPKATLFRQLLQQTAKDADDRVFALFDQLLEQEGKNVFRSDIRIDDIFWGTSGLDYTKGIEWVKTLPDDLYGWKYMIPSMIYAWSHHDMDAVIDYVSTVGDPSEKARYDSMIVHNMLSTSWDMEKTWDFATSLPAERHSRDLAKVLDRWSRHDPAAAATHLDEVSDTKYRQDAIKGISGNWAGYAPNEAIVWAEALPSPNEQTTAFSRIAQTWAQHDSYQASEWVGTLDGGAPRDAAVASLVKEVAPFEGDAAWAWAQTIDDHAVRLQAAQEAFKAWSSKEPGAAAAAVRASDLTSSDKQELLKHLP